MTETPVLNLATTAPTLASMGSMVTNLLVGVFLLVSIVMILLVLIQRPQGGGLSGAFGAGGGGGGGGAGQTAFGTKTGDVLTIATIGIFVCFLVFAVILNFATRPQTASPTPPAIATPADGGAAAPLDEEPGEEDPATDLSETPDETQPADQPDDQPAGGDTAPAADEGAPAPTGEPDAGDE